MLRAIRVEDGDLVFLLLGVRIGLGAVLIDDQLDRTDEPKRVDERHGVCAFALVERERLPLAQRDARRLEEAVNLPVAGWVVDERFIYAPAAVDAERQVVLFGAASLAACLYADLELLDAYDVVALWCKRWHVYAVIEYWHGVPFVIV